MVRFLARRAAGGLVTLVLFVAALFFVVNSLIPGDFTSQFIMGGDAREALRESLGLNRPLSEQFWVWMRGVLTLDLGTSFTGAPVWDAVRDAVATSSFVLVAAGLVAFPLGFWLGRLSAWGRERWFTVPTTAGAVVLLTAFPPAVAFLLERGVVNLTSPSIFNQLRHLDEDLWPGVLRGRPGFEPIDPAGGPATPPEIFWNMVFISVVIVAVLVGVHALLARMGRMFSVGVLSIVALVLAPLSWMAAGIGDRAFDLALSVLLLIVALIAVTFGEVLLVTDAAMVDSRSEDFVLTARAKGLPERMVRDRHSARAALLPIVSRLVVSIPYIFTGLVILEFVFDVQGGMGYLIFNAVQDQDTPMVVGAFAVLGVMTLLLRLALEVTIAVLDPRIRLPGVEGR
ncbi:MAG: ABC transporter permease [Acidimicrobiia bacterium]|nr:ABC transporter permease [Acidimicrobiia bacterium]MBT8216789.1 ABC transporter permease [Acidimicrobiia bacterium]